MENKKTGWTSFLSWGGKVLNAGWKVALIFIGIFSAIMIYGWVTRLGDYLLGRGDHACDRKLSGNISVHWVNRHYVRAYDLRTESYVSPKFRWISVPPTRDSLAVFCDKDGLRGFMDVNTGKTAIPARFSYAWVFSEGLAAVVEDFGKMGFIDSSGEYAIAPEFDYMPSHDYVFKHGVCCIENGYGKYGLIDRGGRWAVPQEYDSVRYVSEADAFILTKDGQCGVLRNGSFEWLCHVEYDDVEWQNEFGEKVFVLYKDGYAVNVAPDGTESEEYMVVEETRDLKYAAGNGSGDSVAYAVSDAVSAFKVNGKWGVLDKRTGNVIVPAVYGGVTMVSENILRCRSDVGENGVLYDLKGNIIKNKGGKSWR